MNILYNKPIITLFILYHNKRQVFLQKFVKSACSIILVDVAMGPDHTVCLTEHGKVVTMGRNIEAQLGKGHNHSGGGKPCLVKAMTEKEITLISAGSTFTVVGTTENVVYFWGTRHIR